ncbi:MAG: A24 family peptidase [Candidatus Dormibacteria bacterium]
MSTGLVPALAALGGAVGLLSGWSAVAVERWQALEAEEEEERLEYEREAAGGAEASGSDAPPAALPAAGWQGGRSEWHGDRYGWTWLERVLSPLMGAAAFGLFAAHEGAGRGLVIHCLWMAVFVHIVAFDLKHRLILNVITYPTVGLALVLAPVTPGMTPVAALTGAVSVSLFFLAQSLISRGRIGLGDAKLAALIGAVTGLSPDGGQIRALYAVMYAVFLGGGVAMLLLATRLRGRKDPIPYGPFLCAGAALILYQSPS